MIQHSAIAAALLLISMAIGSTAHAGCDEYCADEAREAAYERAYERAYEAEDDDGYYTASRRGSRQQNRRTAGIEREAGRGASRKAAVSPQPPISTRAERLAASGGARTEHSSIATGEEGGSGAGTRDLAADDSFHRQPARAVGCKTYFPSVGMTLSVACDR